MRRASAGLKASYNEPSLKAPTVCLCVRVCIINQPPHLMSEVHSSAPLGHLDMPPASFRLTEHEQVSSAVSLVLVVRPTRLGPDDRSLIGHQLPGCLVETDHGMVDLRGTGPARPEPRTPRSPPGHHSWLEFVFLSICHRLEGDALGIATTWKQLDPNPRVLRVRRCTRWLSDVRLPSNLFCPGRIECARVRVRTRDALINRPLAMSGRSCLRPPSATPALA